MIGCARNNPTIGFGQPRSPGAAWLIIRAVGNFHASDVLGWDKACLVRFPQDPSHPVRLLADEGSLSAMVDCRHYGINGPENRTRHQLGRREPDRVHPWVRDCR